MTRIAIYGANGWTGSLVAAALDRTGVELVLAGRDEAKLRAAAKKLRTRAEVRAGTLNLDGINTVINCAGPFSETGFSVIEAALAARCHYFDVSGEASYVRSVYERYDADARRREITIAPAFAAKGGFGDWAATIAGPERSDEIAIAYAHGLREYLQPSAGSVLAIAGEGLFKLRDDYEPARPLARSFDFPPPFGPGIALLVPTADDVSIPRHLPAPVIRSYVSVAPGDIANAFWAGTCASQIGAMPFVAAALRASPPLVRTLFPSPGRAEGTDSFGVVVEVTRGDRVSKIAITTRDAYATTAALLPYGVARIASAPRGVVAPSQLCGARAALREFASSGLIHVRRWSDA